nr:MAG TPA: hypothetical protein [Bacteriophage sp.]
MYTSDPILPTLYPIRISRFFRIHVHFLLFLR